MPPKLVVLLLVKCSGPLLLQARVPVKAEKSPLMVRAPDSTLEKVPPPSSVPLKEEFRVPECISTAPWATVAVPA